MKPTWDPQTKKLSGHYFKGSVQTVIKALEAIENEARGKYHRFIFNDSHLRAFTMKIAYMLGLHPRNVHEVPAPVRRWAKRVFRTYTYPKLYEAFITDKLSTRFVFEISDYIVSIKYSAIVDKAIAGEITNTEFRTLIKENR